MKNIALNIDLLLPNCIIKDFQPIIMGSIFDLSYTKNYIHYLYMFIEERIYDVNTLDKRLTQHGWLRRPGPDASWAWASQDLIVVVSLDGMDVWNALGIYNSIQIYCPHTLVECFYYNNRIYMSDEYYNYKYKKSTNALRRPEPHLLFLYKTNLPLTAGARLLDFKNLDHENPIVKIFKNIYT